MTYLNGAISSFGAKVRLAVCPKYNILFYSDFTFKTKYSHLSSDLVATLAGLKVNDFPHFGRNRKKHYDEQRKS